MADRKDLTAVFEAALGNAEPLAIILRSDKSLEDRTRIALAMLLEGKLIHLEIGRGRPPRFRYWEEYMNSAFVRAEMILEFEENELGKKLTHEQVIERALAARYSPGAIRATEEQLRVHLRKAEGQRPRPPEPQQLRTVEHWIQYQFEEHQRKTRLK